MWIAKVVTLREALDRLVDLLPLLAAATIGVAILEISVYFLLKRVFKSKYTLPYTLVAPAAVALLLFTVYPFLYNIRLAFSDLRLKTMSCYIPNTDVTNAECSLSRAAPNVDVKLAVDELPVYEDRNAESGVAYIAQQGDELRITGRELKSSNYLIAPNAAVQIEVVGPGQYRFGRPCNPVVDRECAPKFQAFKDTVLANQDERDWWPVENPDGQKGWIPNEVYYAVSDSPVYAGNTGDEVLQVNGADAAVSEGQQVRLSAAAVPPTNWYPVQVGEDQTGWINANNVVSSRTFTPETDATLYQIPDTSSETVGEIAAGVAVPLNQNVTYTWYQVRIPPQEGEAEGRLGWVRAPVKDTGTITVFSASTDAPLYPADANLSNLEGVEPIGQITAGEEVVRLAIDDQTSADTIWFQVETRDGTIGWTNTVPGPVAEVQTITFTEEYPLWEGFRSDNQIGTVPADVRLEFIERNEAADQVWYQVRGVDGTGWTNVAGAVNVNYSAVQSDDAEDEAAPIPIYAEVGGRGGQIAEVEPGDPLSIADTKATRFTRYRIVLLDEQGRALYDDEGNLLIGWLDQKPRTVITTEREPVLYSLDYGWRNFKRVFVKTDPATGEVQGWGRLLQTQNSTFPRLMRTTLAWTSLNVVFHLIVGMILALMLNRSGLKFKGLYRAIIILPWAIPQPIIALTWKAEFHSQFGFVNSLLTEFGLQPVDWLFSPGPAFAAVTFVNIWLGIPFYMVTLLGGLQSIAGEYYEAAEIDGANAWQRFRHVTVPLIRPVAVPIVTLDVIWTFNNFNVIYLITEGRPNETTNILVTALYNAAFGRNGQFQLGFAAAFSLVIFAVLFLFASVWVTSSGALKGVYES